jgi:two-component system response regulator YesN
VVRIKLLYTPEGVKTMKFAFSKVSVSFFISYFVILFIPLILSIQPLISTSRNLQMNYSELNASYLSQAASTTEQTFDSALNSLFRLSQSSTMVKLFYADSPLTTNDRVNIFTATQYDMKQACASFPIAYRCYVFFIKNDFLLTNDGKYTVQTAYDSLFHSSNLKCEEFNTLLYGTHHRRIIDIGNALCLIHSYPYTGMIQNSNLIAIIAKQDLVQYLEANSWFSQGYFCISNTEGSVLLSNGTPFSSDDKIYTASQQGKWGLTYSFSIDESTVARNLPNQLVGNYVLFYCGALFLGILISIIFSFGHYQPIKKIVNTFDNISQNNKEENKSEYEYIFDSVNNMVTANIQIKEQLELRNEYMRRDFMQKLLRGHVKFPEVDDEQLEKHYIAFPYPLYVVFLIQSFRDVMKDYSISFQIAQYMNRNHIAYICETNDYIACVVNFSEESALSDIETHFLHSIHEIEQAYTCTISSARSDIHTSYAGIHNGYEEAKYAMEMVSGEYYRRYMPSDENYGYSKEMEKALRKAVLSGNHQETSRVLNEIFNLSHGCSMNTIKYMAFSIISFLQSVLEEIGLGQSSDNLLESADKINQFTTSNEINGYLQKNAEKIIRLRNDQMGKGGNLLIEHVKTYILNHLTDENLNVTQIAEAVHISYSYLSRLFKQEIGENLSDYISKLRIEMACDLLKNSPPASIKDICEHVGYSNMTSFGRIFKNIVGMTPGQFRQLHTDSK